MASGGEMRAFVFSISFIIIFSGFLVSMPLGLQGAGESGEFVTPLSPSLLTEFTDTEGFNTTDFIPWLTVYIYEYTLNSRDWICGTDNVTVFDLNAKHYFFGLWFGQLDIIRFKSHTGVDRSDTLSFIEIDEDAEDGLSQYTLTFGDGTSAGDLITYYNTTAYSNSSLAWGGDELYFLHGVGVSSNTDVIALLLGLLFLQLPDVPFLVNLTIVTPIWASIAFLVWFIIKESLPFI